MDTFTYLEDIRIKLATSSVVAEALAAIEEAIQLCLEVRAENGLPLVVLT